MCRDYERSRCYAAQLSWMSVAQQNVWCLYALCASLFWHRQVLGYHADIFQGCHDAYNQAYTSSSAAESGRPARPAAAASSDIAVQSLSSFTGGGSSVSASAGAGSGVDVRDFNRVCFLGVCPLRSRCCLTFGNGHVAGAAPVSSAGSARFVVPAASSAVPAYGVDAKPSTPRVEELFGTPAAAAQGTPTSKPQYLNAPLTAPVSSDPEGVVWVACLAGRRGWLGSVLLIPNVLDVLAQCGVLPAVRVAVGTGLVMRVCLSWVLPAVVSRCCLCPHLRPDVRFPVLPTVDSSTAARYASRCGHRGPHRWKPDRD